MDDTKNLAGEFIPLPEKLKPIIDSLLREKEIALSAYQIASENLYSINMEMWKTIHQYLPETEQYRCSINHSNQTILFNRKLSEKEIEETRKMLARVIPVEYGGK